MYSRILRSQTSVAARPRPPAELVSARADNDFVSFLRVGSPATVETCPTGTFQAGKLPCGTTMSVGQRLIQAFMLPGGVDSPFSVWGAPRVWRCSGEKIQKRQTWGSSRLAGNDHKRQGKRHQQPVVCRIEMAKNVSSLKCFLLRKWGIKGDFGGLDGLHFGRGRMNPRSSRIRLLM